tara:strand:- start:694 stop:873 length:180 start_codon:yes stop_codon:yes gene_type:complete
MKPNFKDLDTGEDIVVHNFKVKFVEGERVYYDSNWKKLNVKKLGKISAPAVFTETKSRI